MFFKCDIDNYFCVKVMYFIQVCFEVVFMLFSDEFVCKEWDFFLMKVEVVEKVDDGDVIFYMVLKSMIFNVM